MNFDPLKTPKWGIISLIVVHFFGVVGILSPWRDGFLVMTPMTLGLSLFALIFTQVSLSIRQRAALLAIGVFGYAVEVVGVWSGIPFGEYAYGPVLGPHAFAVPPIIGINWILVVLAASAVSARIVASRWLRVIVASALMTGFDWVLEPVAVVLDFWHWGPVSGPGASNHGIPLSNYLAWFVISLAFCTIWQQVAQDRLTRDRTSFALYWIQIAFFGSLRLVLA